MEQEKMKKLQIKLYNLKRFKNLQIKVMSRRKKKGILKKILIIKKIHKIQNQIMKNWIYSKTIKQRKNVYLKIL